MNFSDDFAAKKRVHIYVYIYMYIYICIYIYIHIYIHMCMLYANMTHTNSFENNLRSGLLRRNLYDEFVVCAC